MTQCRYLRGTSDQPFVFNILFADGDGTLHGGACVWGLSYSSNQNAEFTL